MEPQQKLSDFRTLPEQPEFPEFELDVLNYWEKIDAFKTQLEKTKDLPPYTFYDGPPFATGTPHYGHICAGTIKDVVTRYATQTGHYVERRFGWDCHGLPIEYEIDKEHEVKTRDDVLKVGVDVYNGWCRNIVMKYEKEWRKVVNRMGRWIDFDNDYKTMDLSFMESVWWVFKQMWDKGLVYRGAKVMPYSLGCSTVLSNFEAGQNFKDVIDPSVYVSFPLVEDPSVKLVAWTTTPWTLPSNIALCVNADFDYVKIRDKKTKELYILAKVRLPELYKKADAYEILETFKGATLEGKQYVPLFDYFASFTETGGFRVLIGDHVTNDAGTGVVHTAPGFGADDYKICLKHNIIKPDSPPLPVGPSGHFTEPVHNFIGQYVKDPATEKGILQAIKEKGRLFYEGKMEHSYPFCWRSETPLIYRAVNSWFINVKSIKDDLLANNKKAHWVPAFAQEKRFHNWLENAEDWCFSRNRFWGNPIPVWVSDDFQEQVCIGSIEELKQLSGVQDITDLHKDVVDKITIPSKQGKGVLRRIDEVFDCWFESGSMPFAQCHYPFSTNEEAFAKRYPADFIGEGLDQTRGWFYTLNVIATAVTNQNPYKNVIVNGLVLAEDGKKMSKREKNYTDPMKIVGLHGADAVRLYLMNSQLVRAEPLRFKDQDVKLVVKNVLIPWYNVCRFLVQSIKRWESCWGQSQKFTFDDKLALNKDNLSNVMDRWVIAANQDLIKFVREEMSAYRLYTVVPKLLHFLDGLTRVYLKLNKGRLKGDNGEEDQLVSLNVLFDVLLNVTVLMSPFAPFVTEVIYQILAEYIPKDSKYYEQSVHFLRIPEFDPSLLDEKIDHAVELMTNILDDGREIRTKRMSFRQPVQSLTLVTDNEEYIKNLQPLLVYIQEELNVEEVLFESDVSKYVSYQLTPDHRALGAKLQKAYTAELRKKLQGLTDTDARKFLKDGNKLTVNDIELTSEYLSVKPVLKKETLPKYLELGGEKEIKVLFDLRQDESMLKKGVVREVLHKIQKLRKDAGLNPEDDIVIFIDCTNASKVVKPAIEATKALMDKTIKRPWYFESKMPETFELLAGEAFEHESEEFDVLVCKNPFASKKGTEEENGTPADLNQENNKKKKEITKEVAYKILKVAKSCNATDENAVTVFFNFKGESKVLKPAIESFQALFTTLVSKPLHFGGNVPEDFTVLAKETFTCEGEEFEVTVCEKASKLNKEQKTETKSNVGQNEDARRKTTAEKVAHLIQGLRRNAGVNVEKDVEIFIRFNQDSKVIKPAFETQKKVMDKIIKKPFDSVDKMTGDFDVLAKESYTYEDEQFEVLIVRKLFTYNQELGEATVKEVVNKLKKLKKSSGIKDEDDVAVFVGFQSDSKIIKPSLEANKAHIEETMKKPLYFASEMPKDPVVVAREKFKYKGEDFEILFVKGK